MLIELPTTPALSAVERERQRQAYIAAVDAMATQLKVTIQVLNATTAALDAALARIDALEQRVEYASRPWSWRDKWQWLMRGVR